MVWNDKKIKESKAVIPMREEMISPASIDLTVGDTVILENGEKLSINDDLGGRLILSPGEFALLSTSETVTMPADAVGILKGKSSRAREGLFTEFGNLVDPGFSAPLTIPVKNGNTSRSVIVEPNEKIIQMFIMDLNAPAECPYDADDHHYQGVKTAMPSWQGVRYADVEEWRPVRGYKGYYEVSSLGRVRSLPRKTRFGTRTLVTKQKILRPVTGHGYLYVVLSKRNKHSQKAVHRLVADAFIPNYDNLPAVNHKDEDKSNNRVSNLEWCTPRYNNLYSNVSERGAEACRIPVVQETKDGKFVARYASIAEASRATGVRHSGIDNCINKRKIKDSKGRCYTQRTAGGYKWRKDNRKDHNAKEQP